jgi:hypothetical protein
MRMVRRETCMRETPPSGSAPGTGHARESRSGRAGLPTGVEGGTEKEAKPDWVAAHEYTGVP